MDRHWDSAHKKVRSRYGVFKPGTLRKRKDFIKTGTKKKSGNIGVADLHWKRYNLIVENIMTLGLINVFRLSRAQRKSHQKQANSQLLSKLEPFCARLTKDYNLEGKQLLNYMMYRLELTKDLPEPNPNTSRQFAEGWASISQDYGEKLGQLGIT
jgi:hypothetical protein